MTRPAGADTEARPPTPALRFLAAGGRVARRRPVVVAGGLLARAGLIRAFSLWPDATAPVVGMSPRDGAAARWMPDGFPRGRGAARLLGPGTWHALRARGLLVCPDGPPPPVTAAEQALGRRLRTPGLAIFSPGATIAKTTCFVVERGRREPTVVVKAMTQPRHRARLTGEADLVESLRARLAGEPGLAATLPAAPVGVVRVGSDTFLVERFDPVMEAAGRDRRAEATAWLGAFQRRTEVRRRPWSEQDVRAALATLAETVRPEEGLESLAAAVASRLEALRGASVPCCAVHGDFWRGNLALRDGTLRVFDWEWGALEGDPFLDPWMYEIGPLRGLDAESGDVLDAEMRQAVRNVETALGALDVDPAFAAPMGAVVVAEIVGRVRRATGRSSAWEATARPFLRALARILTDDRHDTSRAAAAASA
jgi:hypothetical protein